MPSTRVLHAYDINRGDRTDVRLETVRYGLARISRRWLAAVVSVALMAPALVATPQWALAQAVSGAGDDAIPIPKGGYRFRIGGLWNDYTNLYTDVGAGSLASRPLLDGLATSSLGTRAFPQLGAAEQSIRTLSAQSNFVLSLGTFEAVGDVRQATIPLSLERGITRRISVGVVVPYVESRNRNQLVLNRNGTSATVGQNPAYATAAGVGAGARTTNGTILRQLALARTQLSAEINRCANIAAINCAAIRANPAGAQSLLQQALSTQSAIGLVYGDSTRGGSPVVPISGSTVHTAIVANVGTLRTAFAGFGVTSIAPNVAPAPATVVYGPGSLAAIAGDSAFGLSYTAINGTRRAGIGDIDLTFTALLHDTFGADQQRRLSNRDRAVRSSLTAGFRFGSAGADRAQDPLDVPIGEGASAVLLRSTTDYILNRRFWISGTLRIVHPLSDQVVTAVPLLSDSTMFRPFSLSRAQRDLGQRAEIEIAPRLMFGEFFGLSGAYLFRRVGADVLTPALPQDAPSTNTLLGAFDPRTSPARTVQAITIAASFSSLASYVRRGARYPLELLFTHTAPIRASGGTSPVFAMDRLELRIYRGFPRR